MERLLANQMPISCTPNGAVYGFLASFGISLHPGMKNRSMGLYASRSMALFPSFCLTPAIAGAST